MKLRVAKKVMSLVLVPAGRNWPNHRHGTVLKAMRIYHRWWERTRG